MPDAEIMIATIEIAVDLGDCFESSRARVYSRKAFKMNVYNRYTLEGERMKANVKGRAKTEYTRSKSYRLRQSRRITI